MIWCGAVNGSSKMMNLRAQMEDNQQPIDSARRPDQSIGFTVALCFWCVFTFVTQNWVSLNMARQNGIFLQGTNCDNYHQFELSKTDWSETARKLLWSKNRSNPNNKSYQRWPRKEIMIYMVNYCYMPYLGMQTDGQFWVASKTISTISPWYKHKDIRLFPLWSVVL